MQVGVTIYYRGILREPGIIHALISEASDIAGTHRWGLEIRDDPWDSPITPEARYSEGETSYAGNAGLKGIILHPHPEAGSLTLLFDQTGTLRTQAEMTQSADQRHGICHVSTQYAGIDLHIALIRFLEYIGAAFMQAWKVEDDSGYFAHRDREQASLVFEAVDDAIDAVTEAFSTIDIPEDISGKEEEFLSLLEDRIRTYLPDVEIHRFDEEE